MKTKSIYVVALLALTIFAIALAGCASPKGLTLEEKRLYGQDMRTEAMRQLYRFEPGARSEIIAAPGYAVFEAVQTQVLITSVGNAYGIIRDNQTGEDTYMSAFSAGAGFGAGVKGYRAVVIFKDRSIMNEFINKGWVFGASGSADVKSGTEGVTVSGAKAFDKRLNVYTFTDKGLMAGASLRGVKVWKNKELN